MATGTGQSPIARSATLPLAALCGLGIACSGATAPDQHSVTATAGDVNSCTNPATASPPVGVGHPLLGAAPVSLGGLPFAVAISTSGVTYVTQLHAATASRANLPSTSFSPPFPVGDIPSQVRMSPDGKTAYVGDQDAGTITYVDVATNHAVGTASAPAGSVLTIGLTPDGKRLYALTDFHGVYIINATSREVEDSIPADSVGTILAVPGIADVGPAAEPTATGGEPAAVASLSPSGSPALDNAVTPPKVSPQAKAGRGTAPVALGEERATFTKGVSPGLVVMALIGAVVAGIGLRKLQSGVLSATGPGGCVNDRRRT